MLLKYSLNTALNYYSFYRASVTDVDLAFSLIPQVVMPAAYAADIAPRPPTGAGGATSSGGGGATATDAATLASVSLSDFDLHSRAESRDLNMKVCILIMVMLQFEKTPKMLIGGAAGPAGLPGATSSGAGGGDELTSRVFLGEVVRVLLCSCGQCRTEI